MFFSVYSLTDEALPTLNHLPKAHIHSLIKFVLRVEILSRCLFTDRPRRELPQLQILATHLQPHHQTIRPVDNKDTTEEDRKPSSQAQRRPMRMSILAKRSVHPRRPVEVLQLENVLVFSTGLLLLGILI